MEPFLPINLLIVALDLMIEVREYIYMQTIDS